MMDLQCFRFATLKQLPLVESSCPPVTVGSECFGVDLITAARPETFIHNSTVAARALTYNPKRLTTVYSFPRLCHSNSTWPAEVRPALTEPNNLTA
jgi:hypothetical protein